MSVEGEKTDIISSGDPLTVEDSSEPNYQQYLHRLFGEATAEYFLNPTLETDTPPWYTQLMDRMADSVSAEVVWNALNERTRALVMEIEANSNQTEKVHLGRKGVRCRNYFRHLSRVRLMFRSAKYHEAFSAILLEQNPPPFIQNLEGAVD